MSLPAHSPEVAQPTVPTITIGGRPYTLTINFNALCDLESELGLSMAQAAAKAEAGSLVHVRALVWAALREHHPDLTVPDVGRLIEEAGGIPGFADVLNQLTGTVTAVTTTRRARASKRPAAVSHE